MNAPATPEPNLERRLSGSLLEVRIRAGLVFAMAVLCYQKTHGILGMSVSATLLTLGYQNFMWWVATAPDGSPTRKPVTAS